MDGDGVMSGDICVHSGGSTMVEFLVWLELGANRGALISWSGVLGVNCYGEFSNGLCGGVQIIVFTRVQ